MIVATAAEMRAMDAWAIANGTPGYVLMERAGAGAARVLREHLRRERGPVVVVCGKGNNGGDGFVIARHLRRARQPVEVWLAADPRAVEGDALRMLAAWRRGGGKVAELRSAGQVAALRARLERAGAVVDALLGTGLSAPVTGVLAEIIAAINAAARPVLAVDIASGLSAEMGAPLGTAVRAAVTATFGFAKLGQVVFPGVEFTGRLEVVDIGIPEAAVAEVAPACRLLDPAMVGPLVPRRAPDAHKGTAGHVLVIAGSRGKTGAALLAAEAAGRAGAGLTTLASAAALQHVLEGHVREAMTAALPDGPDGTAALGDGLALTAVLEGRSAVVCGPGLGLAAQTRELVAAVVRTARVPLVLDADGLNAVAGTSLLHERPAPTVVTPHPGEMARLLGTTSAAVQADRLGAARRFAADQGVVVVLKGARTLVTAPGGRTAICPTGNPGMASGGMGDALCGILGALLAQGLAPADAAALGVYAHGLAADRIVHRCGEIGLLARDVIDEMPPALAALSGAGGGVRDEVPRAGR